MAGLLPPHRDWELGVLSSLMLTFQRDGSQVVRKTSLGCRGSTSPRGRERMYNCKYSTVNALKKREVRFPESWILSKGECQAEGNVKAAVVKSHSDWTSLDRSPPLDHSVHAGLACITCHTPYVRGWNRLPGNHVNLPEEMRSFGEAGMEEWVPGKQKQPVTQDLWAWCWVTLAEGFGLVPKEKGGSWWWWCSWEAFSLLLSSTRTKPFPQKSLHLWVTDGAGWAAGSRAVYLLPADCGIYSLNILLV